MDKTLTIILAAFCGFVSIVADQATYQTEKLISNTQDLVERQNYKLVQNLDYWSANIQNHKDIYFGLNNALLDLNMSAIERERSILKGRRAWNPDTDFGKKMLESRPPYLTDDENQKLLEEYVEDLRHSEKLINAELNKLILRCANYLFEIDNCMKIQKEYFAKKSSIEKLSLVDANDRKLNEIDQINIAYFDDYLTLFLELKRQNSEIAYLNFRRQLLIIASVIFNMFAIISLLLFFRQNILRVD
ncbi:hypothetical protein HIMB100_00006090 [SAR116 cluster alpha proteobacterium HIMB100]|nr:hypothetical protein HIMB100_00006090 [SAR116 cluster alpha proteobacterium HIMB100]